jgi:hypothetical protein
MDLPYSPRNSSTLLMFRFDPYFFLIIVENSCFKFLLKYLH